MIPVKLSVRNFMCYRDNVPPLSFDGIHLACLSGDNGNGKSALIDAMTWALWGKARASSDDDLIYTGQVDMEVEFDFTVGQQMYRIIRKRSKPKRRRSSRPTWDCAASWASKRSRGCAKPITPRTLPGSTVAPSPARPTSRSTSAAAAS